MFSSQLHSIHESTKSEGCLLLWLEGNVVFSLNESALVIWLEIERNSKGVTIAHLVEYLDNYFLPGRVSRLRLRLDVEELITTLSKRGFLKEAPGNCPEPVYRIKEDVFRTVSNEPDGGIQQQFNAALAYQPNDPPESGRLRALA